MEAIHRKREGGGRERDGEVPRLAQQGMTKRTARRVRRVAAPLSARRRGAGGEAGPAAAIRFPRRDTGPSGSARGRARRGIPPPPGPCRAARGHRIGRVHLLLKRVYKKQGVSGQVALMPRALAVDALP